MSKPMPLVDDEADAILQRLILAPEAPPLERVVLDGELAREVGTHTRYMRDNLAFVRSTTKQVVEAITDLHDELRGGRASRRWDRNALAFLDEELAQVVEECTEGLDRVEAILAAALEGRTPCTE